MTPRLDIRHLRALSLIAETGAITATANRLGLTQSAISHRLREAERRLGIKLTERGETGIRLTAEGERLRIVGEQVIEHLARTELEVTRPKLDGQTIVRIGQATYSRYHWWPDFNAILADEEPDIRMELDGMATSMPFAALNSGAVDVAMIYGREIAEGRYRWQRLAPDPLVVALAPDHRLADRAYLDAEDIADEQMFSYPLSAEPGYEWEALIGAPETPFRWVTPMPTPEAVIDLVRTGMGIGIFCAWAIRPEIADGTLIEKPIGKDGTPLDWWAVTRLGDEEGSPTNRVADALVGWSKRRRDGLATMGFSIDS